MFLIYRLRRLCVFPRDRRRRVVVQLDLLNGNLTVEKCSDSVMLVRMDHRCVYVCVCCVLPAVVCVAVLCVAVCGRAHGNGVLQQTNPRGHVYVHLFSAQERFPWVTTNGTEVKYSKNYVTILSIYNQKSFNKKMFKTLYLNFIWHFHSFGL